jgi:hypothetical protein
MDGKSEAQDSNLKEVLELQSTSGLITLGLNDAKY